MRRSGFHRGYEPLAGIMVGLATGLAQAGSAIGIDFKLLAHGQIVDEQIGGVRVWAENACGGPDLAVIFDSRQRRSTADRDLEGPAIDGSGHLHGSWEYRFDLGPGESSDHPGTRPR